MKKAQIIITSLFILVLLLSCNQNTPKPKITLNPDNGTEIIVLEGEIGENATLPTPFKDGYIFIGWFDDAENKYLDNVSFLESSFTLKARWDAALSIKGTIALPNETNLNYSDFWLKVSDGTIIQISSDGSFEIKGLKTKKSYDIYFSNTMPCSAVIQARGSLTPASYGAQKINIITHVNETLDLGIIPMLPTLTATGKVTLQDTYLNDYSGINVSIPGSWFTTTTDNEGNYFLLGLPEGTYTIKYSKQGFAEKIVTNIVLANEDSNPSLIRNLTEIQLPLYIGLINGIVHLEGLSDYSGVKVSIPGTNYITTTDEDGEYSLTVEPGTYSTGLLFKADDYASETINTPITVTDISPLTMTTIKMKAINATTVSGFVKVKDITDCSGIKISLSRGTASYTTTTDEEGLWVLNHVPIGNYSLKIIKLNIPEINTTINIESGINDVGTYNLLPNGASITGYVNLEDQYSAEGINVLLKCNDSNESVSYKTKADGYYLITNIDPSLNYTLSFSKTGWSTQTTEITGLSTFETREIKKMTMKDDIDPLFESFIINNGENTTKSRNISINTKAKDFGSGIFELVLSFDELFNSYFYKGKIEQIVETELPSGNGYKTIYARVYDNSGNYSQRTATIKITSEKCEVFGILSGDNLHWTAEYSPYLVTGDIVIPVGSTLIIDPGVDVQFKGEFYIQVEGNINAIGTEDQPISFYSFDPNLYTWKGINGKSNHTKAVLDNGVYKQEIVNILKNVILRDGNPCAYGYLWIENATINGKNNSLGSGSYMYYDSQNILESCYVKLGFQGDLINSKVEGNIFINGQTSSSIQQSEITNAIIFDNYFIDLSSCYISNSTIGISGGALYNNYFSECNLTTIGNSGFRDSYYNTFDKCKIKITGGWNSDNIEVKFNEFIDSDIYHYYSKMGNSNFQFNNFLGEINIYSTTAKNSNLINYTKNYWEGKTAELNVYNLETTNLSFITDYFDNFSYAKIDCSNWINMPFRNIGYNLEGQVSRFSFNITRTFRTIADDNSISGYISLENPYTYTDPKYALIFRCTENIEDFLNPENDGKFWDYNTKSFDYEFSHNEVKDFTIYIQAKDNNGFISGILEVEIKKETLLTSV